MISFVDQEKRIRVFRIISDGAGQSRRESLGFVSKREMQIPPELREQLVKEELSQLERALQIYSQTQPTLRQYHARHLPVILREVGDYFESEADQVERELVMAAVVELLRRIRAFERNGAVADEESEDAP